MLDAAGVWFEELGWIAACSGDTGNDERSERGVAIYCGEPGVIPDGARADCGAAL